MLSFERMTVREIHDEMDRISEELDALKKREAVLAGFLNAYQNLLNTKGAEPAPDQPDPAPVAPAAPQQPAPVGLSEAIERVLQRHDGRAIHVRDLWEQVRALGATSTAKDPEESVDTLARNMRTAGKPYDKPAPRYWRWSEGRIPREQSLGFSGQPMLAIPERAP